MSLREYQINATSQISQGWRSHKGQILVMPTGSGKTFTFAYMAKLASERGKTIIILTHRDELFGQTYRTFEKVGLLPIEINADSKDTGVYTGVFVVMVETLANRPALLDKIKPDLVIIDECHDNSFSKILDQYPDAYRLGVTATPKGKHLIKYYTNLIDPTSVNELISNNFLVPYKAYQMQDDFSDLKKGKDGDYSATSQYEHFSKTTLYGGVIDEWKKRASNRPTIVFNCNIKHSDEMAQAFRDAGIESHSITSKTTKKERKIILERFHNGEFFVLNNSGILVAGYDHPPISCVILNMATDSLIKYLQTIGRGSRPWEGKYEFICLDFGGNHTRHGMWNQDREWSLTEKKKTKLGAAIVKDCPSCEAMLFGSVRLCGFCGFQFPLEIKDLKTGVMVQYFEEDIPKKPIKECTPEEIALLVRLDMFDRKKATAILRLRGMIELKKFANAMGYSNGWAFMQMQFLKQKK